jgi:hypothetical protein
MGADYSDIILWSVFLFLSYIGYGAAIVRLLNLAEFNDFGWAAKAAVGMSATIVLGSVLMVFKAATPAGLTSVAVMGFGLACYFFYLELNKPPISTSNKSKGKSPVAKKVNYQWLFLVIPGAFALLTFATSVYWPFQYDPNDDWIAYLAFPEKILQTGTLIEPFSQRRITSLCGQSVLLAQIMIVAEPESAHLLDRGFGAILLFGILVEATQKTAPGWQWLRALFILAAVTVSVPRINTSSTVIGVCLMFGVLFSISKVLDTKDPSWKIWVLPALILAGASSLRSTYALTCGGALAIYFFWRTMTLKPKVWVQQIQPLFKIGIFTFLFLSPLMTVSWESSLTPIYPLFNGNLVPHLQFAHSGLSFFEDAKIALSYFLMPQMMAFLIILNLVFCIDLKKRLVSIAMVFTTIVIGFLVAFNTTGNAASWTMDFYRLVFPIFMTTCLWLIVKCIESSDTKRFLGCQFMACVGLLVFFWPQAEATSQELQVQMEVLKLQEHGFKFKSSNFQPHYQELQDMVPAGEKIFAVVDAPYLLNYSRNPIWNVDNIACASPRPGMPFNKGAPALEEYLRNLGIKYLLVVDFDEAVFLYNRQVMEDHPRPEFRTFSKKYIVDFLNNIDALAEKKIISKNTNTRLIKIGLQ